MENTIEIIEGIVPRVTTVGFFEVDQPWVHGTRALNINTMLFVISGTVYVNEDGIDYVIPENHVFFFKSGCKQTGTRAIQPGSKWYWVSFNTSNYSHSSDQDTEVVEIPKMVDCSEYDTVSNTLIRMNDLYISDLPYKGPLLDGYLHQIFYELLNLSVRQTNEDVSKNIAPRVIRLLNKRLEYKFSADYIAQSLEMNYCYIGRLFKAETGMSINHYNMQLKINQAINLLHTSDLNIAQISEQLNYPNPYYFSRVFKKVTGMSPKAYKQHMYLL